MRWNPPKANKNRLKAVPRREWHEVSCGDSCNFSGFPLWALTVSSAPEVHMSSFSSSSLVALKGAWARKA